MKYCLILILSIITFCKAFAQTTILEEYQTILKQAGTAQQKNEFNEAIEYYQQLLKIIPEKPYLNFNIAKLYAQIKKPEEAILYLKKSLELGYTFNGDLDTVFNCIKELDEYQHIVRLISGMKEPINNSEVAFTINENDLLPEGIAYDSIDNCFYIGSLWKCKILKLEQDGSITEFIKEKQDGLRSVAGIHVDDKRRFLWAVSFVQHPWSKVAPDEIGWSAVFKYDLRDGKLIKKYEPEDKNQSYLFNDLVILNNGDVFITDTFSGKIFTISHIKDELEVFIECRNFMYPNGITTDDDEKYLYIANSNGTFVVDIASKSVHHLSHPGNIAVCDIDGMYFYENSLVCVQNGLNRISRFYLTPEKDSVVNVEVIETRNPHFILPTTGCLAGDNFYYIANSQAYSVNQDGSLFPDEKLAEIIILKTELKNNSYLYDSNEEKKYNLGEPNPANEPQIFAPGLISTELDEYGCSFSPGGREFYFTRTFINPRKHTIMYSVCEDSGWTTPRIVPFKSKLSQGEPNFSPDGNKILFGRIEINDKDEYESNIYRVERTPNEWGIPKKLFPGMFATITKNGTIYFTDVSNGMDKAEIYCVNFSEGRYQSSKAVGNINSEYQDAHPFIDPDEKYIIFDSNRSGGYGSNDLYISYRSENGEWSKPVNLGERINSSEYDAIPYVTPDKKYLFFNRLGDIYWVEAKVIEELRSKK